MRLTFINQTPYALPRSVIRKDVAKLLRSLERGHTRLTEVTIVCVPDRVSELLHRRFLKKRQPANVLSFLYGGTTGELVLAPGLIRREAAREGERYRIRLRRLIAHGMLHLLGHHHEGSRNMAQRFDRIEGRVFKLLKILNPKLRRNHAAILRGRQT